MTRTPGFFVAGWSECEMGRAAPRQTPNSASLAGSRRLWAVLDRSNELVSRVVTRGNASRPAFEGRSSGRLRTGLAVRRRQAGWRRSLHPRTHPMKVGRRTLSAGGDQFRLWPPLSVLDRRTRWRLSGRLRESASFS